MAENRLSGGLDPSIFAQAGRPAVALQDPMEVAARALAVRSGMNANQLFQANTAAGQAFQASIDPTTGLPRNNVLGQQLRGLSPENAIAVPGALAQGQSLSGAQQGVAERQTQFLNQAITAVLALPDAQLHGGAVQALLRAKAAGMVNDEQALRIMGTFSDKPAELRTQLRQIQLGQQAPGAQQEQIYGAGDTQNDGQNVIAGVRAAPANGGGFTPSTATPVYPSRSELGAQDQQIGPDGQPVVVPRSTRLNDQGRADLGGPAGTPPGRVPRALLPPGYTGRYAAPGGTPASGLTPGPATAAPLVPAQNGAVPVGLAPGQSQEADAAVSHASEARAAANTFATRMQPLMAAQEALKDAKTGAGSERLNTIRQTLQSFTPGFIDGFRPLGGSAEQDAAFDEARKYLTNYAANTPGANRSDAGGQTAANANANVHISPLAARYVVQAAVGMERMRQAQTLEFNASGHPGSAYDRFQSGLATKADPRAFIADQQTPDERKKLLDGMTAPQRANYLASVRLGVKHGLLNLPGAGG